MENEKYKLPSISFLKNHDVKESITHDELLNRGKGLVDFLASKNIKCSLLDVDQFPSVYTYNLKLESVKPAVLRRKAGNIAKYFDRQSTLVTTLDEKNGIVRVEVVIDKYDRDSYGLKQFIPLLKKSTDMKIPVALGMDLNHEPVITDLAKQKCMLIESHSSSGEQEMVNNLILSILYTRTPDEVRFLIAGDEYCSSDIDGIPHLLKPIAKHTAESVKLLTYCINEMEDRYERKKTTDISSLPSIVLVIRNFPEMLEKYPDEFTRRIRILGKRAAKVGIYIIIATPSFSSYYSYYDVNISEVLSCCRSRVVFNLSDKIECRKLIGNKDALYLGSYHADMLFKPVDGGITRVQGIGRSEKKEINRIANFWKKQCQPDYTEVHVKEFLDNSDVETREEYHKYRFEQVKECLEKEGIHMSDENIKSYLDRENSTQRRYDDRIAKAMAGFTLTDDMVRKIIEMNDGLYERFRSAYNSMKARKAKLDKEFAEGKLQISGYSIFVNFYLGYKYDENGIPTANSYMMLYELSDETREYYPQMDSDEKTPMPEFSEWEKYNLPYGSLGIPELDNHHIYAFMKTIFQDANTFCLADIKYLKPDDLTWDVVVDYERFAWDKTSLQVSFEDMV